MSQFAQYSVLYNFLRIEYLLFQPTTSMHYPDYWEILSELLINQNEKNSNKLSGPDKGLIQDLDFLWNNINTNSDSLNMRITPSHPSFSWSALLKGSFQCFFWRFPWLIATCWSSVILLPPLLNGLFFKVLFLFYLMTVTLHSLKLFLQRKI